MDPITSVSRISGWFNDKLITTTYENRHYKHGNPVTKVEHHVTAELYNKHGKLEVQPKVGINIDKKS